MGDARELRELERERASRSQFDKLGRIARAASAWCRWCCSTRTGAVIRGLCQPEGCARRRAGAEAVLWSTSRDELPAKGATLGDARPRRGPRQLRQNSLLYRVVPRTGGVSHDRRDGRARPACYWLARGERDSLEAALASADSGSASLDPPTKLERQSLAGSPSSHWRTRGDAEHHAARGGRGSRRDRSAHRSRTRDGGSAGGRSGRRTDRRTPPRRGSPTDRTGRGCRRRGSSCRGSRRPRRACGRTGSPAWSSARSPRLPNRRATDRDAGAPIARGARGTRAARRSARCASSRCPPRRAGNRTRAARAGSDSPPDRTFATTLTMSSVGFARRARAISAK